MDLVAGDIVRFDSAQAGHTKYHICVLACDEEGKSACFLFLNSRAGWKGEFVLNNDDIPCIPPSKTGLSVVSFSTLVRQNAKQLKLYRAEKIGRLSSAIARKLEDFAKTVPTLNAAERKIVLKGLSQIR